MVCIFIEALQVRQTWPGTRQHWARTDTNLFSLQMSDPSSSRSRAKSPIPLRSGTKKFEPWEKWFGWSRSGHSWANPPPSVADPSLSNKPTPSSDPILNLLGLPEWYLAFLGATPTRVAELVPQSEDAATTLINQLIALSDIGTTASTAHVQLPTQPFADASNVILALLVCINQALV